MSLECAPGSGQGGRFGWVPLLGLRGTQATAKHRSDSAAFKRHVAEEFIAGGTPHGLSRRHGIARQLIRIRLGKHEGRIAAPDRLVGKQAPELVPHPRKVRTSHRSRSIPGGCAAAS